MKSIRLFGLLIVMRTSDSQSQCRDSHCTVPLGIVIMMIRMVFIGV